MRITLELASDVVESLAAQARAREVTLDVYLETVLESLSRTAAAPPDNAPRVRTLRDALAVVKDDRPAPRPSAPRRKKTDKYYH